MDRFLQFVRDYGAVLDLGLIVALTGYLFRAVSLLMKRKDEHIQFLEDRVKASEEMTFPKVNERMRALKEYYEKHMREWHNASIETLESQWKQAVAEKETQFKEKIEQEIKKRNELMERYLQQRTDAIPIVSIEELCGVYSVTGSNPLLPNQKYFGELVITAKDDTLFGNWYIGRTRQRQRGLGFIMSNVVSFVTIADTDYKVPQSPQTGIVSYEVIAVDALKGHWTAFPVDDRPIPRWTLGVEDIRKLSPEKGL